MKYLLIVFLIALSGCKSSDEKLFDVCIGKLESQLNAWAKYDGWKLGNIKANLLEMEPDKASNQKYGTDKFYNFEVIMINFTVKNGYNTDINSYSICTGRIYKESDGYDAPSELLVKVTLNGQRLGL